MVLSAGADTGFAAKYSEYTGRRGVRFLIRDTSNPSSSMSSMETARFNARMVRTALTRETWEAINEAWMALKRMLAKPIDERDLPQVLDAIKRETALIRGCFYGTMLEERDLRFRRRSAPKSSAPTTPRASSTSNITCCLPSVSWVGSTLDNYQWESILRSVSGTPFIPLGLRRRILGRPTSPTISSSTAACRAR